MKKESVINQKLLICLVLMIVGTYAGRGAFMEPNCHKYRADGSCECCSFRFWMTPDGCCKQVSDQCKDWCSITGKCTCCYLGYVLDNGCCVLPCNVAAPAPKCEEPSWKKCEEPVKKCEDPSWKKCEEPVKKCEDPSLKKCDDPSWKKCDEPVICVEPNSCKSGKSYKSCKSAKRVGNWEKPVLGNFKKFEAKNFETRSVMNRAWVGGASKDNVWNKPTGLRVNNRH